jgi:hypothetical protein
VIVQLADDLARLLDGEPLGVSCDDLAQRIGRRRSVVLDVLRADPRFMHLGIGRGSRWRVSARLGTEWDGQIRDDREQARVRAMLDLRGPWWGL